MENETNISEITYKSLRRTYYIFGLGLLATGLIGISALDPANPIFGGSVMLEKIKTIIMIVTFFSIPGIFGWFTSRIKHMEKEADLSIRNIIYAKAWKARIVGIFVIAIINIVASLLTFDRSLMYILAIVVFIFFYCRPKVVKPKAEPEI